MGDGIDPEHEALLADSVGLALLVFMPVPFMREMRRWLADGRIVYPETVFEGLEQAPQALMAQLTGENVGKVLVRVG